MKKSLIVLLSVMVVLAFAASAFAKHMVESSEYTPGLVKAGKSQIEFGGEIRIRGDLKKNADFNDDLGDTTLKYDQRVRLRTKANVTDKTFGFVELETTDNSGTRNKNSYDWGSGSEKKKDALYIRQAYISHQFGMIGGIKAGHMLFALGNRLFFDHTNYGDDGLIAWIAAGPGEVSLVNLKLDEGTTTESDDWEAYVVALEMPVGPANVSADVTYLRDHDKTAYTDGENFINLGVRADADLKVVKVKADVEVQTGKAKEDVTTGEELKYKGLAAMVGVEANAGPATVRGGVAYGSGDDDAADNDSEAFRTFLTDNQYSTFIYDYTVNGASGTTNKGLNNTMYVTVGASVKPIADLKVAVDAYLLRAAEEVALNGSADKSKKLGYEIDGKIEYQIASNLAYYIEAGMLFAGEAYDSATDEADNPYRVRHGLLLQF